MRDITCLEVTHWDGPLGRLFTWFMPDFVKNIFVFGGCFIDWLLCTWVASRAYKASCVLLQIVLWCIGILQWSRFRVSMFIFLVYFFFNWSVMCVACAFPHSLGQFSTDWDELTILLPIHSVIPWFAWFSTKLVTPIVSKAKLALLGVNSVDSATSVEKHLIKSATIIVEKGVG